MCLSRWKQLGDRQGHGVFVGMRSPELPRHIGKPFLYMDHGYWRREPLLQWFRLIHDDIHLTHLLDRPGDRWKAQGRELAPWRRDGRTVVVIPPSEAIQAIYGDARGWLDSTLATLAARTERPVLVKQKGPPLPKYLQEKDAWAVVTYASVAGVEAALHGYPVFAGPHCPALPISAGPIEKIGHPVYRDREPWLHSLAYSTWHISEFNQINLEDYHYRASCDDGA